MWKLSFLHCNENAKRCERSAEMKWRHMELLRSDSLPQTVSAAVTPPAGDLPLWDRSHYTFRLFGVIFSFLI